MMMIINLIAQFGLWRFFCGFTSGHSCSYRGLGLQLKHLAVADLGFCNEILHVAVILRAASFLKFWIGREKKKRQQSPVRGGWITHNLYLVHWIWLMSIIVSWPMTMRDFAHLLEWRHRAAVWLAVCQLIGCSVLLYCSLLCHQIRA